MINTKESKKVLFRLKKEMKTDLSVALVKQGVGAQHTLEAITERIIAFDKGENLQSGEKKFIISLLDRAKELQAEAKLCV